MRVDQIFATSVYSAKLGGKRAGAFLDELRIACRAIQQEDVTGQDWSARAGYKGYTSYASLDDLPSRSPTFADLVGRLGPHLLAFANAVEFDMRGLTPHVDSIWINVLEPGGTHTGHIHPNSVISGTLYLDVPDGASALRLEDPRLPMMMAAPPRKAKASAHNRSFVYVEPSPGSVILWESWLRHEVTVNMADEDRVSVSFNAVLV
ncbi:MAG: TIGR02466 family protein [Hyphomicrobiaceae bacterium]